MIFSRRAIMKAIEQGKFAIDPYYDEAIEVAHINLHLEGKQSRLAIQPKEFVIAQTKEKITLARDICGFMEGKASLAKLGLSVEQSSTFVEPGTDNHMTLEIFNASDQTVHLETGQPIAKLFLAKVVDDV